MPPLVFMMGRSPVFLPTDRLYARNHMWAAQAEDAAYRCGLTGYAVRLLGDLRRLEWSVPAGAEVVAQQTLGTIEGSKAVSDLFAPASGVVRAYNPAVPADPSLLNSNLYDSAWLLDLATPHGPASSGEFLSAQQYLEHLEFCWPVAQRILKGQVADPGAGKDTESRSGEPPLSLRERDRG